MQQATWDPKVQYSEIARRKQRQDGSLATSGSVLGLINALFLVEVLSVNEDTNTFLVVGGLCILVNAAWLVVARRAGQREVLWVTRARSLEKEVLQVPDMYSVWGEATLDKTPIWVAQAFLLAALTAIWIGLLGYAFWFTYL